MWTKVPSQDGGVSRGVSSGGNMAGDISRMVVGNKRCLYSLPLTIVALLGGAWLAAQFYAGQGLPDVQVCVLVYMRVGGVSMRERVPCVRVDMCVRVFVDTSVWVCAVCAGGEQEVPLLSASRHCPFCWKARAWVLPHTYKFRS